MTNTKLCTVAEAAEIMRCSEKTIRRMLDARKFARIPYGPTGRGVRLFVPQIERHIADAVKGAK